ncbi:uncharacterized protein PADG_12473 [Paracoccidioides brasiliensis Pb18]|uniref:non-specific serine/threonine protein kinase n=1 Tax=Paracoccidioides brasiliensis (strain Pb18) TaxID=502780 RepID=A0A0A0HS10_PARBD|nr:uncharacterized protein PADG_12473 [Paracoccidioides brasiliensis Pb18]KGM91452.1 hypothetical protein PADG_12473 [Paracoccidioides brasiliensis Pb18]
MGPKASQSRSPAPWCEAAAREDAAQAPNSGRLKNGQPPPPSHNTFHTSCPRRTTDKSPAAASETAPKYKYIEDCERLERYCPGGFYPLKLGDRLCDGCYSIVQNLGFGGSFTVWLASDQKQQELVAIKIESVDSASKSQELDAIKVLGLSTDYWIFVSRELLLQTWCSPSSFYRDKALSTVTLRNCIWKFGNPILEPIVRVDGRPLPAGVPTHVVGPARVGIRSDQITPTYLPHHAL